MTVTLFITGTDTGVGKTTIAYGLIKACNKNNYRTLGIKPVASGCAEVHGQLINADAAELQKASSVQLQYNEINPFAFKEPIAPHIAAKQVQQKITVATLLEKTQFARAYPTDVTLIEGAGGWYCPLNEKETMADFVKTAGLKTILVIGMRVGCLNHTLLTYQAILNDQVKMVGWIANVIDPKMAYLNENIETLTARLAVPCLGVVQYLENPEEKLNSELIISEASRHI